MTDYGPSIKAARLFERTSANGNVYFTGRMGALRVSLLKSRENADDGAPIWNLMLQEAPAKPDAGRVEMGAAGKPEEGRPAAASGSRSRRTRDWQRPLDTATAAKPSTGPAASADGATGDSEIPF